METSNMNNLFQLSHQNISKDKLIPLTLFHDNKFRQKIIKETKYEIPTYSLIEEGIKYLDKPIINFYFSDNPFSPFIYLNNHTMMDISIWSMEFFKEIQMKSRIEKVENHLDNLVKTKQYERLFFMIDKRITLDFYISSFDDIPDDQKYDCFEDIYSRSEYGFSNMDKDFFLNIFKYKPKVDLSENIKPDDNGLVKIYRGQNTKSTPYQKAFSWTIDKEKAIFFATRFDKYGGELYEAMVKFEDILAYIDRRGESEVIINPDCLIDVKRVNSRKFK